MNQNRNCAALAARIRADLVEVERVVNRTEHLLEKAGNQKDEDYLDGVALNLYSFYVRVERIFEEIAGEIDGAVPNGPHWQRNLLRQMSSEVTNTRPAVVTATTHGCLDEYRSFRDAVRSVYNAQLRPSRLEELGRDLRSCAEAFIQSVMAFCEFLDGLSAKP